MHSWHEKTALALRVPHYGSKGIKMCLFRRRLRWYCFYVDSSAGFRVKRQNTVSKPNYGVYGCLNFSVAALQAPAYYGTVSRAVEGLGSTLLLARILTEVNNSHTTREVFRLAVICSWTAEHSFVSLQFYM